MKDIVWGSREAEAGPPAALPACGPVIVLLQALLEAVGRCLAERHVGPSGRVRRVVERRGQIFKATHKFEKFQFLFLVFKTSSIPLAKLSSLC